MKLKILLCMPWCWAMLAAMACQQNPPSSDCSDIGLASQTASTEAVSSDSGYDPDLLIPHWDAKTDRWGYMHRSTKAIVVPHQFTEAGKFDKGYALAIAPQAANSKIEDFYRITSAGAQLLYSDARVPEKRGILERGRMRDDWIVIASHDRVVCFDPTGKLRLDTLVPGANKRFCYLQQGRYYLLDRKGCNFIQLGAGKQASWDTTKYTIAISPLHPNGEAPFDPYFIIQDNRSLKVGILDATGKLVVPITWEMPLRSLTRMGLQPGTLLYNPCIDSFYLGYRDARFYLMHLDGRVVQAYSDTLLPTARDHLPWRLAGQLYAFVKSDEYTSLIALGTPKEPDLLTCDGCGVLPLDSTHVFNTWWSGHAIYDITTETQREFEVLKEYERFAAQYAVAVGNRVVYVLAAGPALEMGAIDDRGEIVVPIRYQTIEVQDNYPTDYPMLVGTREDEQVMKVGYFTTDGKLRFGGEFIIGSVGKGKAGELAGEEPATDDHLHHCKPFDGLRHHLDTVHPFFQGGEFPPNRLLYVERLVEGKGAVKGYVDMYGVQYF